MTKVPAPFQHWDVYDPSEGEVSDKKIIVGFSIIFLLGFLTLVAQLLAEEYFSALTWLNGAFLCIIGYSLVERISYSLE